MSKPNKADVRTRPEVIRFAEIALFFEPFGLEIKHLELIRRWGHGALDIDNHSR